MSSKLREMIERNRAQNGDSNVTKPLQQPNPAETQTAKNKPAEQIRQADIVGKTTEQNQQTNGSTSGQEKFPVLPTGLAARLVRNKKQDTASPAQVEAGNIIAEVKQPSPQPIIVAQPQQSASQAADAEKTNTGTVNVEELRRNLNYLAMNIEHKELVGNVVRTIAEQLKNNPQLVPYMQDRDVDLVTRGLRQAFKIAARKKIEKSNARQKTSKDEDALMSAFKAAGLDALIK